MQYYKVITGPTELPITLEECKDEMRVEHNRDDIYITSLIGRAVDYLEKYLERPIMSQIVEITTDDMAGKSTVALPSPVISVDAITGVDIDYNTHAETETALTVGDYTIWDHVEPTALFGDFDSTTYDYYRIRCTSGYANSSDVPDGIKDILFLLVTSRYQNRLSFQQTDIRQLAVNYRFAYIA